MYGLAGLGRDDSTPTGTARPRIRTRGHANALPLTASPHTRWRPFVCACPRPSTIPPPHPHNQAPPSPQAGPPPTPPPHTPPAPITKPQISCSHPKPHPPFAFCGDCAGRGWSVGRWGWGSDTCAPCPGVWAMVITNTKRPAQAHQPNVYLEPKWLRCLICIYLFMHVYLEPTWLRCLQWPHMCHGHEWRHTKCMQTQ